MDKLEALQQMVAQEQQLRDSVEEAQGSNEIPKCKLKRVSPTAMSWFEKDRDRFIMIYVLGQARDPQTPAMAMGSAFDARIKGQLEADLMGKENRWLNLFEAGVDPQHREVVAIHSKVVLDHYIKSGAYKAFLAEIKGFQGEPRFEFNAEALYRINDLDCPIYGKPDAFFDFLLCYLIIDWKVNGYFSKASPDAGYVTLRGPDGHNMGPHKNCTLAKQHGFMISLSPIKTEWQTQLLMYEWMTALDKDKPCVVGIEQLAFTDRILRVATHRTVVQQSFRATTEQRVYNCWKAVTTGHYYDHLTKEESDDRVRNLLTMDDLDKWVRFEA